LLVYVDQYEAGWYRLTNAFDRFRWSADAAVTIYRAFMVKSYGEVVLKITTTERI